MNPEMPTPNRDEIEVRLTALLLGELPPSEAELLRWNISQDAELAKWHDRLKNAIDLVREVAAHPEETAVKPGTPLRLSEERRQQLLAHFKTVTPREFAPNQAEPPEQPGLFDDSENRTAGRSVKTRRKMAWLLPLAAVLVVSAVLAVVLLPALAKRKVVMMDAMDSLSVASMPASDRSQPKKNARQDEEAGNGGPINGSHPIAFYRAAVNAANTPVVAPPSPTAVGAPVPMAAPIYLGSRSTTPANAPVEFSSGEVKSADTPLPQRVGAINVGGSGGGGAGGGSAQGNLDWAGKIDWNQADANGAVTPAPLASAGSMAGQSADKGFYFLGPIPTGSMVSVPGAEGAGESTLAVNDGGRIQDLVIATNSLSVQPELRQGIVPDSRQAGSGDLSIPSALAAGLAEREVADSTKSAHQYTTRSGKRELRGAMTARLSEKQPPAPQPAGGEMAAVAPLPSAAPMMAEAIPNSLPAMPSPAANPMGQFPGNAPVVEPPKVKKPLVTRGLNSFGNAPQARQIFNATTASALSSPSSSTAVTPPPTTVLLSEEAPVAGSLFAPRNRSKATQSSIEEDRAPVNKVPDISAPLPEVFTQDTVFSTFSLNVSDVSFKLAAASLEHGVRPPPGSIRSEEFINAFDYRDPEPPTGSPVGFAWERARDPFAHNRDLLRFSIKTAAEGRPPGRPLNLVLLLDKSGSMERADRVAIMQSALRVLAAELQAQDTLSVVTFARTARLWVDGVPGSEAGEVFGRVGRITPQGGTNLEEAMKLAYATALRHFQTNGLNRVVLMTDGAANLGEVDPLLLKNQVEMERKQGFALDCFGIGWEDYNDDLLEVLSSHGDGRYGFLNTPEEAASGFATQLAGAFKVAAADVKVQVEFNPQRVTAFRQVGYASHQLTKDQFRDNTVDAAVMGAAESGNALYTVQVKPQGEGPVATVRVRFRTPGTEQVQEHSWIVPYSGTAVALDRAGAAMRLAATAGLFAEWLANSPYAADVTPNQLAPYLHGVSQVYGTDRRPKKLEEMIRSTCAVPTQAPAVSSPVGGPGKEF